MTVTSDLLTVLHAHNRQMTTVTLEKVKDCQEFWHELSNYMYGCTTSQDSKDSILYSNMIDFKLVDSLEVVNKQGRILKRFANFFKKQTGTKLDDETAGVIGDRLQYYLSKESTTFFVDFTDVIDWSDGMFGKDDSCWFENGCYSKSRETFTDGGGWGIRFYESESDRCGIGRTWILPRENVLFCFNAYGVSRPVVSKVLKSIFAQHGIKLHYKVMERLYNSQDDNIPYINMDSSRGSSGAFVMYPDDISEDNVPLKYDIDMEVVGDEPENRTECSNCGRWVDDDSTNYIGDDYYCERCTDRLFRYCESCSEYVSKDEVHEVVSSDRHYSTMCEYCAERKGYVLCEYCEQYTDEYIVTVDDNECYCNECRNEPAYYCETCEDWYSNEHTHDSDDDSNDENQDENQDDAVSSEIDTTGLIETVECVRVGVAYNQFETHELTTFSVPDCTGLFLHNINPINGEWHHYNIVHRDSGLSVISGIESFSQAKDFIIRLSSLADWNRFATAIQNDTELCEKVMQIRKEMN